MPGDVRRRPAPDTSTADYTRGSASPLCGWQLKTRSDYIRQLIRILLENTRSLHSRSQDCSDATYEAPWGTGSAPDLAVSLLTRADDNTLRRVRKLLRTASAEVPGPEGSAKSGTRARRADRDHHPWPRSRASRNATPRSGGRRLPQPHNRRQIQLRRVPSRRAEERHRDDRHPTGRADRWPLVVHI